MELDNRTSAMERRRLLRVIGSAGVLLLIVALLLTGFLGFTVSVQPVLVRLPESKEHAVADRIANLMDGPLPAVRLALGRAIAAGLPIRGTFGLRLVMDAVDADRTDVLAMLIKAGAPVNGLLARPQVGQQPQALSPLEEAVTLDARLADPQIVRMLLAAGASPYTPCPGVGTPYLDGRSCQNPRVAAIMRALQPPPRTPRR